MMTAVPLSELSADADPAQSADLENSMAVTEIGAWGRLPQTDRLTAGENRIVRRRVPRLAIDAGAQKYNPGLHN